MTPSEVATAFFSAIDRRDWPAGVALLHPDFAIELRRDKLADLLGLASAREKLAHSAVETFGWVGYDPSLTPELLARLGHTPVHNFPGAATVAELAALPLQTFIETFLAISTRFRPVFEDAPDEIPRRQVIGETLDGPAFAHVLYRFVIPSMAATDPRDIHRLALKKTDDGWRIVYLRTDGDFTAQEFLDFGDLKFPDDE